MLIAQHVIYYFVMKRIIYISTILFISILCMNGSKKKPKGCSTDRHAEIIFYFAYWGGWRCGCHGSQKTGGENCGNCYPFQCEYNVNAAADLLPSSTRSTTKKYVKLPCPSCPIQASVFYGDLQILNTSGQTCKYIDLGSNQTDVGYVYTGAFSGNIPSDACRIILRVFEPCFQYPNYCRGAYWKRNQWNYVLDIPKAAKKPDGTISSYIKGIFMDEYQRTIKFNIPCE